MTYRSLACPARWLIVLAVFWLVAASWSPGTHAFAAEPLPAASAVHIGEETGNNEPELRCPQRAPVKRPRVAGDPAPARLAVVPPAPIIRVAPAMDAVVPARRTERLSVWRV